MTTDHQLIVYGPMKEGEKTSSGGTYPMPGWGWSCTCSQSGFGYESEEEAERWAEKHEEGSRV